MASADLQIGSSSSSPNLNVFFTLQIDEMGRRRVWAIMKSGDRWEGDILVGADGIHSKVCCNALLVTKILHGVLCRHCLVHSCIA